MKVGLGTIWEAVADVMADEVGLVEPGRRFTIGEHERRAARLAAGLAAMGVGPGDRVALYIPNSATYLEALFAALKLGAIPVNVNYRYGATELIALLRDCEASALVYPLELEAHAALALASVGSLRVVVRVGAPASTPLPAQPVVDVEGLIDAYEPRARQPRPGTDRLFVYTGGTTGLPKGVVWQQQDLIHVLAVPLYGYLGLSVPRTLEEAVAAAVSSREQGRARVTMAVVPLMHATGLFFTIGTMLLGGKSVLTGGKLDPRAVWRGVAAEQVDTLIMAGNAVAAPLVDALEEAEQAGQPYELSSVDRVVSSGAVLSDQVKLELHKRASLTIIDTLGASEGGPFAFAVTTSVEDLPSRFVPAAGTSVLREDGTAIEKGGVGVGVLAYTGAIPLGYHDDPDRTAKTFPTLNGVRYTVPGDLAELLADGSIRLLGRRSGVINSGGEKVHPQEVENVLLIHPSVRDVIVVGVPDPRWGEQVGAVVSAEPGHALDARVVSTQVRAHLAGYKVPRVVAVVPEVRRTNTGKPDLAWARLALEAAKAATATDLIADGPDKEN
jgi:acyl-CoA synthetase (AMP-forming)/AMP-acid ligase II